MLIAQITDSHIGQEGQLILGRIDTGRALSAAVATLNALMPQPEIVLFTGDLAEHGTGADYQHLRARLSVLNIPLAVVPGNHDRRAALRQAFADNPWLPAGDGPLHQIIDNFALRLIGLDTLDETATGAHGAGHLDTAALDWLEARLGEAPERPTVIFMHHPPFNTGIGHMDRINCTNGAKMAAIVARHPQVERVLCGHVHRPVSLRWAGTMASICPSLAHQVTLDLGPDGPAAFIAAPPALQLHLWVSGQGLVSHTLYPGDYGPSVSFTTGLPVQ